MQRADTPTRARGKDTPHILDLVITNNDIIDSIDYLAPLGKSDHSVFRLDALALSVSYSDVAGWLSGRVAGWLHGWLGVCHTPVLYQNG